MRKEIEKKTELEILEEKKAKLVSKINDIYYKQLICKHDWDEPYYDPYKEEGIRQEWVYQGSDSHYDYVGTGIFYDKPRWTRICKKCGKKEHAYDYEDVVVKTEKRLKFKP